MDATTQCPKSPESITAEWITDALSTAWPDTEVSGITILDQHSGTTGRMRVGLEYASGASGPASVFIKLPPFDEAQRQIVAWTDMGRREARFYQDFAPEVPMLIPRSYFAAYGDEPTDYVMVLEDLQASGVTFTSREDPRAEDSAQLLIESLGHVHAHFWNDPRLDAESSWVQPAMRSPFGAQLVEAAREQFADQLPPVFTELCKLFVDNWERITTIWDDGPSTLVHGDTHAGNQFIDDATVGLYDWAVVSRSPGIRDVAIYLANSCPTELRRREQDRWLHRYHAILVDSGVDAPEFGELWESYRRTVLYGWLAATTTAAMGSKWQPIEYSMRGVVTATAACADLDTINAISAAL